MDEQIERCPNCGNGCQPCANRSPWSSKWVECSNVACQYRGPVSLGMSGKDGAIDLHNRVARAIREAEELRAENTRLRAALAMSDQPCVYCSLPSDEWAKCKDGFPGCARGDDSMGCPHLGDGLELQEVKAEPSMLDGEDED